MATVLVAWEARIQRPALVLILALVALWILAFVAITMVVTSTDLAGHLPLTGHAFDDTGIA